jgi:uncharacterized protein (TIGR02996 family)
MDATREQAFLDSIIAAPEDDAPRLVYADWLSSKGDLRGELITLQCQLTRLDADDERRVPLERREQQLLLEHGHAWLGRLRSGKLTRGLRSSLSGSALHISLEGPELFARAPISELTLRGLKPEEVASIAQLPFVLHVIELSIVNGTLGDDGLRQLLHGPRWRGLRRLRLHNCDLGPGTAPALLAWPGARQLDALHVVGRLGGAAVALLGRAPQLAQLEALTLHGALLDNRADFLARPALPEAAALDLSNNALGDDGVAQIVRLSALRRCRRLMLGRNELGLGASTALARAGLAAVEALDLSMSNLGPEGLATLSDGFPALTSLGLFQGSTGDVGAGILARSSLRKLAHLNLCQCGVTGVGVRALGDGPWRALESLDLSGAVLGEAGARALVEGPALRSLRSLSLRNAKLGDEELQILARGHWPRLRTLDLMWNKISATGVDALAASDGFPALTRLGLYRNDDVPKASQQRLIEKFGGVYLRNADNFEAGSEFSPTGRDF